MRKITVAGSLVALAASLAACGGSSGPTAESMINDLNQVYPVTNVRDTSESCACEQRITTDSLTLSEWSTPQAAQRWDQGFGDAMDVRQVGRFTLAWNGDPQELTSQQARAAWTAKVRELTP